MRDARLRERIERLRARAARRRHVGIVIYEMGATADQIEGLIREANPPGDPYGVIVVPDEPDTETWTALAAKHFARF